MSFRLARQAKVSLPIDREMFLSVLGGLESGVATTTAIVIGLTISERDLRVVIIAAYVAVIVQAFNSAAARYTGLRASEEIDDQLESERLRPFVNSIIQFAAHGLASLVPILSLYHMVGIVPIVFASVLLGYATLLVIGAFQGYFLRIQAKENLIEILFTGTLVILVGSIAGLALR